MRQLPRSLLLLAAALALAVLQTGCASKPPASDPEALAEYNQTNDPLEPTNRVFYAVNNGLDTVILRPAAIAYRDAVPETVRAHTHNVLANLSTPVTLFDDMLEAKPRLAGDSFMRLLLNTTVGVGGVFDVATGWGWPAHETDGGITLALWGLPNGPYLFLPVLGPSSPRDAVGFAADTGMDPLTWIGRGDTVTALDWSRYGLSALDTRASLLSTLDRIKAEALDPYATIRSLYQQHRQYQIEQVRSDNRATVPAWFAQPPRQ
jgi:phospholipid-binding lipoprotein MlaA